MSRVDDVMLMAYVDGEVDPATAREIEKSIADDAELAARARAMRDSAALARAAFTDVLHEPVPHRLAAIFDKVKFAEPAAGQVIRLTGAMRVRQIAGMALAASIALAVFGVAGLYMTGRLTPPSGLQFAASDRWLDHVAGFYTVYSGTLVREERMLIDFASDDIPELEKWFGAKLNRSLQVPDLSSLGYAIQGGRLLVIGGEPAAQFIYNSPQGELVGLVIAFTPDPDLAAREELRKDVNIVHWRKAGYAYAFVGKLPFAALREIADKAWRELDTI